MSQTEHRSHSLSFLDLWTKFLLCLLVTIALGFLFIQFWLPAIAAFVAAHWLLIGGVGSVVAIGGTAPKTVPMGWKAFRAIKTARHEDKSQEAYYQLLAAATEKVREGYNFKYNNARAQESMELINPYAVRSSKVSVQEEQEGVPQIEAPLPTNVRYEDVRNQVPQGHVLVGVGRQGVETKEQAVGACVWIVGLSGTGKTSTTVLRVEERHAAGHKFLGVDPHWFKPDSLTNAIAAYASDFLLPIARSAQETLDVLQAFLDEFNNRKAGRVSKPWQKVTLLVDEVGALMDPTTAEEEEVAKLLPSIARICGQEARNFNMGGIFISQQATGLAWLRKVALMVIVHQLLMESEKKLALNGDKEAMESMKTWPVGRTYVFGVGFQEGPRTVQQPYFERVVDSNAYALPNTPRTAVADFQNEDEETFFDGETIQFTEVNTGELSHNGKWLEQRAPNLPNLPGRLPEIEGNGQSGKGKDYLFTEAEKPILINLYNKFHSIEECLKTMKKGARYHKDASRLLKDAGLL